MGSDVHLLVQHRRRLKRVAHLDVGGDSALREFQPPVVRSKSRRPTLTLLQLTAAFLSWTMVQSCGARYPGGVCVHHPGISPKVNGEKPWMLFKT